MYNENWAVKGSCFGSMVLLVGFVDVGVVMFNVDSYLSMIHIFW